MSPIARVRPKAQKLPRQPDRTADSRPARSIGRLIGFRPFWHKGIGAFLLLGGAGLFFVCEFNGWHLHQHGGHIWYLVGLVIAAASTWWFGLFDAVPGRKAR